MKFFEATSRSPQEAADKRFRLHIMLTLRAIFTKKELKQGDIAKLLDISQPRASDLMRGKLDKFSSDKLIGFLAKLGYEIAVKFADDEVTCELCDYNS